MTDTLAMEVGPANISVNSILPGVVDGARIRRTIERHAAAAGVGANQMTEQYFACNLLGQLQQPEEIAAMVLYLCSPAARSITGQAIRVDADHQTLK